MNTSSDLTSSGRLEKLRILNDKLLAKQFPANSDNKDLADIFADLALYDGHIAGLARSVLDGHSIDSNLLKTDEDIHRRIQRFVPLDEDEASVIRQFKAYERLLNQIADELQRLYEGDISEV